MDNLNIRISVLGGQYKAKAYAVRVRNQPLANDQEQSLQPL